MGSQPQQDGEYSSPTGSIVNSATPDWPGMEWSKVVSAWIPRQTSGASLAQPLCGSVSPTLARLLAVVWLLPACLLMLVSPSLALGVAGAPRLFGAFALVCGFVGLWVPGGFAERFLYIAYLLSRLWGGCLQAKSYLA